MIFHMQSGELRPASASINSAACQRHTFSVDRSGTQTNAADGKSDNSYGWLLII